MINSLLKVETAGVLPRYSVMYSAISALEETVIKYWTSVRSSSPLRSFRSWILHQFANSGLRLSKLSSAGILATACAMAYDLAPCILQRAAAHCNQWTFSQELQLLFLPQIQEK